MCSRCSGNREPQKRLDDAARSVVVAVQIALPWCSHRIDADAAIARESAARRSIHGDER
jgi:hypothetical protein